jgi:hypothetical protein
MRERRGGFQGRKYYSRYEGEEKEGFRGNLSQDMGERRRWVSGLPTLPR